MAITKIPSKCSVDHSQLATLTCKIKESLSGKLCACVHWIVTRKGGMWVHLVVSKSLPLGGPRADWSRGVDRKQQSCSVDCNFAQDLNLMEKRKRKKKKKKRLPLISATKQLLSQQNHSLTRRVSFVFSEERTWANVVHKQRMIILIALMSATKGESVRQVEEFNDGKCLVV